MNKRKLLFDDDSSSIKKESNKNTIKIVRMYKCMVCNEKFSNKTNLTEHKLTHAAIKPYECMYCEYKSSLKDIMMNHISIQHGVILKRHDITTSKKYDAIIQEYKCTICNGQFATKRETHDHHVKNKMCKSDSCSYCYDASVKSNEGTDVKEENLTDDENDDVDGNESDNIDGDTKRMTIYKCTVCTKQFRNKSSLYKHNSSHYDLKSFGCQYCDYRCSLKGIMKNHLEIRHGQSLKLTDILPDRKDKMYIRAFRCTTCNKVLPSKDHLRNHLVVSKECKRFKCLFCDYKSSMRGTVNRHMQTKHNHVDGNNMSLNIKTETDVSSSLEGSCDDAQQKFKMEIESSKIFPDAHIKEEIVDDEESRDIQTKYKIISGIALSNSFPDIPIKEEIVDDEESSDIETKYNITSDIALSNSLPDISIKLHEIPMKEENVNDEDFNDIETKYNIGTDIVLSNSENIGDFQGGSIYYFTEDCIVDGNVILDTYIKEEIVTDNATLELLNDRIVKDI